ncbi:MAG: glycosyltransferase [Candidatus Wallbacteria bacterium]|nr:glycosyltransferase [Candidatus Wallbacteria bacterium]
MPRKRVTFVVSSSEIAGAERQALLLAGRLKSRSEIRVICSGGKLAEEFKALDLPVKSIPLRDNFDPWGFSRLIFHLKQHKPDLLHLHLNRATLLGGIAAKTLGIPSLGTLQSFTSILYARFPDLITVCSPGMKEHFSASLAEKRIRLVYNPIDLDAIAASKLIPFDFKELGISGKPLIALYSGRLHPNKGVSEIIEFAERALKLPLHFVIAGDGNERCLLERLKHEKKLQNLTLAGFRSDILNLTAGADFLILPSCFEGLPLSLCEGLALEKPFVAYSVGDVGLLSRSGGGIAVPPGNRDDFYQALVKLSTDCSLRLQMGKYGRSLIEREFRVETCLEKIEAIYDELLIKN